MKSANAFKSLVLFSSVSLLAACGVDHGLSSQLQSDNNGDCVAMASAAAEKAAGRGAKALFIDSVQGAATPFLETMIVTVAKKSTYEDYAVKFETKGPVVDRCVKVLSVKFLKEYEKQSQQKFTDKDLMGKTFSAGGDILAFDNATQGRLIDTSVKVGGIRSFVYSVEVTPDSSVVRLWFAGGPAGTIVVDLMPATDMKALLSVENPDKIFFSVAKRTGPGPRLGQVDPNSLPTDAP